jgi:PST family polysaccharide transporter
MTENAISQVLRAAVFTGGVFLLVRGSAEVVTVGWIEVAATLAMTLYCLYVQQRWVTPVKLRGSFDGFWGMVREGVAVSSTNVVWALIQTLPLILIGALVGGAEVAVFAVAARLVGSILTFSNLYHFNLFPAVSRASAISKAKMAELLTASFRVVAWGGIFAAMAITLFADQIIPLIFGPRLVEAAPVLAVMIWMLPITLCSGHARWGLTAIGEQRKVLWAHIIGVAVLAVLCPMLGSRLGSVGYAIGAVAGPFAIWLAAHVFARLDGNAPPSFLIVLRPLVLALAAVFAVPALQLGLWATVGVLAAFVALAPVLDPKLIGDIGRLGRAKAAG